MQRRSTLKFVASLLFTRFLFFFSGKEFRLRRWTDSSVMKEFSGLNQWTKSSFSVVFDGWSCVCIRLMLNWTIRVQFVFPVDICYLLMNFNDYLKFILRLGRDKLMYMSIALAIHLCIRARAQFQFIRTKTIDSTELNPWKVMILLINWRDFYQ